MTTSVANPVGLESVLGATRESFAALVAAGVSYRAAATRVGLSADYGWDLMQHPGVRQRVIDLAAQPGERIRAGIEAELLILRNAAAAGELTADQRADIQLRFQLLIGHAKLRGWIVDRKQVQRTTTTVDISTEDMRIHLAEFLDSLDPGARRGIEERAKALEHKRPARRRKVIDAPSGIDPTPAASVQQP